MENVKIGLVGIGRLGRAMMKLWQQEGISIGVYHPNEEKAAQFIEPFDHAYVVRENDLNDLDIGILALPAKQIISFIKSIDQSSFSPKPIMINMATTVLTRDLEKEFPDLELYGVKFMGHAQDLFEHGEGLFITEKRLPKKIEQLYIALGKVRTESESTLVEINKLATYHGLKAAIEIESIFLDKNIPEDYINQALGSIVPEIIRGYRQGNYGHFAMEMIKQIKNERK